MSRLSSIALSTLLLLASASGVGAQPAHLPGVEGRASRVAPELEQIGVDERLEARLPLDLHFRNHRGTDVRLGDLVEGERPTLFVFAYHSCPTLCSMVLDATVNSVREVEWSIGVEYDLVVISIDPNDTPQSATEKRAEMIEKYGREGSERGFHFLVGDQDAITAATEAAGIRYFRDERAEQYAHPATVMFLTPDGRLARYLYGIQFNPADVRLALYEASEGRSISTTEQFIMYCYAYDADAQGYSLMAQNVMKLGGGLTILVFGGFLVLMWVRERRRTARGETHRASLDPQTNQVGLS